MPTRSAGDKVAMTRPARVSIIRREARRTRIRTMQKSAATFVVTVAVAVAGAGQAAGPMTRKCNTNWQARDIVIQFTNTLTRDSLAQAIASDPVMVSRGVVAAGSDHFGACFATLPGNPPVTLTEYHNRILDHYFLSNSASENQAIDSGAAGPGWERTGETFRTISMDSCRGVLPVFRFYGSGFNSHFFTADSEECGAVHNSDPDWIFEGNAFGAMMPVDGACPTRAATVYRLYNNRAQFMDSNHRYVVRPELYAQMMSRGWIGEGVAMCLPQSP
jgi:uncharacterized protein DUF5648